MHEFLAYVNEIYTRVQRMRTVFRAEVQNWVKIHFCKWNCAQNLLGKLIFRHLEYVSLC